MFENLGWPEFILLLLIALFVIGPERLPKVLRDVGKMVRKVRRMASDATADISKEVGTDINITDLHPKTFIRKHVLSEADEEALKNPLKSAFSDIQQHAQPLKDEIEETTSSIKSSTKRNGTNSAAEDTASAAESDDTSGAELAPKPRNYDADAT